MHADQMFFVKAVQSIQGQYAPSNMHEWYTGDQLMIVSPLRTLAQSCSSPPITKPSLSHVASRTHRNEPADVDGNDPRSPLPRLTFPSAPTDAMV